MKSYDCSCNCKLVLTPQPLLIALDIQEVRDGIKAATPKLRSTKAGQEEKGAAAWYNGILPVVDLITMCDTAVAPLSKVLI